MQEQNNKIRQEVLKKFKIPNKSFLGKYFYNENDMIRAVTLTINRIEQVDKNA